LVDDLPEEDQKPFGPSLASPSDSRVYDGDRTQLEFAELNGPKHFIYHSILAAANYVARVNNKKETEREEEEVAWLSKERSQL
jgi:hypothetical protein